jgi:hypothetical protein
MAETPAKKATGMNPYVTAGLTIAQGASSLLGGNAQRKAQKAQFDAQRNDAQRQMGQDNAQFAAKLGFERDTDRFSRAKDVYGMQRDQEGDEYRRANTNATNPARRDLISALMARFTGGGIGRGSFAQPMQGGTFDPSQLRSAPAVQARPNYGAFEEAANKEYTTVTNPLQAEQANSLGEAEKEARKRAEAQVAVKMQQFGKGERNPAQYAQQLGFDPFDPANRDKWVKAFMDEDQEWKKLQTGSRDQYARMGAGVNY